MIFENERKRQSRRTKMNAKSWNEKREGKVKKNQSDFLLKHFWQDICLGIIMMPLCAIYTYVISFIWCCFFTRYSCCRDSPSKRNFEIENFFAKGLKLPLRRTIFFCRFRCLFATLPSQLETKKIVHFFNNFPFVFLSHWSPHSFRLFPILKLNHCA